MPTYDNNINVGIHKRTQSAFCQVLCYVLYSV